MPKGHGYPLVIIIIKHWPASTIGTITCLSQAFQCPYFNLGKW
jgi:hypothetical protein